MNHSRFSQLYHKVLFMWLLECPLTSLSQISHYVTTPNHTIQLSTCQLIISYSVQSTTHSPSFSTHTLLAISAIYFDQSQVLVMWPHKTCGLNHKVLVHKSLVTSVKQQTLYIQYQNLYIFLPCIYSLYTLLYGC